MPHVITQACCADASCVYACPVNCIQPAPGTPQFASAEMLHIDPYTCVDCGACVEACPVGAIVPERKLDADQRRFQKVNRDYFNATSRTGHAATGAAGRSILARPIPITPLAKGKVTLRVAVVGSGPAAIYAVEDLLKRPNVIVDVFERLALPYGLARYGIAPDHTDTRAVTSLFDDVLANPRVRLNTGIRIGEDLSVTDLANGYHAVIYAIGAAEPRKLDIPGGEKVSSATAFVGWCNGHPDYVGERYDLSSKSALIIGNGNVALDAARLLAASAQALRSSDLTNEARDALENSAICEVTVVARRGAAQGAFTLPELVELADSPDFDLRVDPAELVLDQATAESEAAGALPYAVQCKLALLREVATRKPRRTSRHIRLRFLRSPLTLDNDRVRLVRNEIQSFHDSVEIVETTEVESWRGSFVLSAIGHRACALTGLPFDEIRGVIPSSAGRVQGAQGAYVVGWAKRGPSGFIGTNKSCSQETVRSLIDDYNAGKLVASERDRDLTLQA